MFLYFVVSVLQVSAGGLNPAAQTSTFCRESIPIAEKDHADLGSYYLSKNAQSSGSKTSNLSKTTSGVPTARVFSCLEAGNRLGIPVISGCLFR